MVKVLEFFSYNAVCRCFISSYFIVAIASKSKPYVIKTNLMWARENLLFSTLRLNYRTYFINYDNVTVDGAWSSFRASDSMGTSRCTKMWMNYISCWEMVVAKVLKRWITDYDNLNNKINSAYFSEHFKRLDLKH